jgi:cell filamentation protein, protein adenylyltransferase
MERGTTGTYAVTAAGGETVSAFIPDPLPPRPALELSGPIQPLLERALLALGRLDSISALLPDTDLFLYSYVRKEAVLSSQIEGTQSSLSDLLLFEMERAPGVPLDDVVEVSGYVNALDHGIARLHADFPLSSRLIREVHAKLLARSRGSDKGPGEFRRTQNWIGGTRPGNAIFVPPPHIAVPECVSDLERFIHEDAGGLPVLVKAALAHLQFETIHPFLDGNGRVGRLLITLILCQAGVLDEPLLYLSVYFKQHRGEYYRLLDAVRRDGDWEAWIEFFLQGVEQTANGAVSTARRLVKVFTEDRDLIQTQGRRAGSALRVCTALTSRPVLTLPAAAERTGLSFPGASDGMKLLVGLGIVRELTGKKRNRAYAYDRYLTMLSEGT